MLGRVPLLRRTPTAVADPDEAATAEPVVDPHHTPGKGRPTPKRKEARQSRRHPVPRNRRDAEKVRRERAREQRRLARQALLTGDERNLPARDRGPARRLARDVVDSRFSVGQFALGMILVLFLLSTAPNVILGIVVRLALLVVTAVVLAQAYMISKVAQQRVEADYGVGAARGVRSYVFWRALTARRMRRPPPKVQRGATV
jgi:hypothetical protein